MRIIPPRYAAPARLRIAVCVCVGIVQLRSGAGRLHVILQKRLSTRCIRLEIKEELRDVCVYANE